MLISSICNDEAQQVVPPDALKRAAELGRYAAQISFMERNFEL